MKGIADAPRLDVHRTTGEALATTAFPHREIFFRFCIREFAVEDLVNDRLAVHKPIVVVGSIPLEIVGRGVSVLALAQDLSHLGTGPVLKNSSQSVGGCVIQIGATEEECVEYPGSGYSAQRRLWIALNEGIA
jgi:hypothetical protein